MQPTTGLLRLALCLTSLSPLASAWPGWLPPRDALIVRQNDGTTAASAEETASVTAGSTSSRQTEAPASSTQSGDSTDTTDAPRTGSQPRTSTNPTQTSKSKHKTFPANAPAGGVTMQDPNTMIVPTPLYKIGDNVTMSWNYTSLRGTPTAVDVLLSCSAASATWTLAANMSFQTAVKFYWDTKNQQEDTEQPLLTEMYTLVIKDSESEITDLPQPGYLGAYSNFRFGMYSALAYTPYPKWKEQNNYKSSATGIDRTAIAFAVTMSAITFASFTWFVTGLGLH